MEMSLVFSLRSLDTENGEDSPSEWPSVALG